jgi:hypothetical protein
MNLFPLYHVWVGVDLAVILQDLVRHMPGTDTVAVTVIETGG